MAFNNTFSNRVVKIHDLLQLKINRILNIFKKLKFKRHHMTNLKQYNFSKLDDWGVFMFNGDLKREAIAEYEKQFKVHKHEMNVLVTHSEKLQKSKEELKNVIDATWDYLIRCPLFE